MASKANTLAFANPPFFWDTMYVFLHYLPNYNSNTFEIINFYEYNQGKKLFNILD